jgi:Uri superfamily endonuclease
MHASAAKWLRSSRLNCREQAESLIQLFKAISILGQVDDKPACRTSLFAVRPDPCEDALRRAK